jgi:hypothetical protein
MKAATGRRYLLARRWSNQELRRLGPLFTGDVVNVSGWDDRDKEGGRYKNYFPNADSYTITNHTGERGWQGQASEIALDLEQPLPPALVQRFDVVYNHTTLEHVFDVMLAFSNLCSMARQAVIVVVPFAQVEHWTDSFGDYWRFSGQTLERLFQREGYTLCYAAAGDMKDTAVYVLGVGVRDPDAWDGRLPPSTIRPPLAHWLGRPTLMGALYQKATRMLLGKSATDV